MAPSTAPSPKTGSTLTFMVLATLAFTAVTGLGLAMTARPAAANTTGDVTYCSPPVVTVGPEIANGMIDMRVRMRFFAPATADDRVVIWRNGRVVRTVGQLVDRPDQVDIPVPVVEGVNHLSAALGRVQDGRVVVTSYNDYCGRYNHVRGHTQLTCRVSRSNGTDAAAGLSLQARDNFLLAPFTDESFEIYRNGRLLRRWDVAENRIFGFTYAAALDVTSHYSVAKIRVDQAGRVTSRSSRVYCGRLDPIRLTGSCSLSGSGSAVAVRFTSSGFVASDPNVRLSVTILRNGKTISPTLGLLNTDAEWLDRSARAGKRYHYSVRFPTVSGRTVTAYCGAIQGQNSAAVPPVPWCRAHGLTPDRERAGAIATLDKPVSHYELFDQDGFVARFTGAREDGPAVSMPQSLRRQAVPEYYVVAVQDGQRSAPTPCPK